MAALSQCPPNAHTHMRTLHTPFTAAGWRPDPLHCHGALEQRSFCASQPRQLPGMSWQVQQTRRFARVYKKLTQISLIADTDAAVETVAENPDVGERKKGDLEQLWVYKFRSQGQLYLLGYTREDTVRLIYLEALGPHENFYRDLKR